MITKKNQQHSTNKGSILIFALIILSLIMVSAIGMAQVTLTEQKNAIVTKNSSLALQNADAGIEQFLQQIYKSADPLDTLQTIADNTNGFTCEKGILSNGTIEITSYKRNDDDTTEVVTDCSTTFLADITRFKSVGEHKDASRAFEVSLKDSLSRGLIARWSFEDNADAIALYADFPGSPTAKDYSVNNHVLTLCPLDKDDHGLDGKTSFFNESFNYCHQYKGGDKTVYGDVNGDRSLEDATWMDHGSGPEKEYRGSSWGVQRQLKGYQQKSGVVDEGDIEKPSKDNDVARDVPYGQALYFNGRTQYLAMNTDKSGRPNYVADDSALDLGDDFAISVWVKSERTNPSIILAKAEPGPTKGYALTIDNGKAFFYWRNNKNISGGSISNNGDTWNHIVVTTDHKGKVVLYINGREKEEKNFSGYTKAPNEPFMVGGKYTQKDGEEPEAAPFPLLAPFKGYIDDIRIYDRGLTPTEVLRLCKQARDEENISCG